MQGKLLQPVSMKNIETTSMYIPTQCLQAMFQLNLICTKRQDSLTVKGQNCLLLYHSLNRIKYNLIDDVSYLAYRLGKVSRALVIEGRLQQLQGHFAFICQFTPGT